MSINHETFVFTKAGVICLVACVNEYKGMGCCAWKIGTPQRLWVKVFFSFLYISSFYTNPCLLRTISISLICCFHIIAGGRRGRRSTFYCSTLWSVNLHRTPSTAKSRIYTTKRHNCFQKQRGMSTKSQQVAHFRVGTLPFPSTTVHFGSILFALCCTWRTLEFSTRRGQQVDTEH